MRPGHLLLTLLAAGLAARTAQSARADVEEEGEEPEQDAPVPVLPDAAAGLEEADGPVRMPEAGERGGPAGRPPMGGGPMGRPMPGGMPRPMGRPMKGAPPAKPMAGGPMDRPMVGPPAGPMGRPVTGGPIGRPLAAPPAGPMGRPMPGPVRPDITFIMKKLAEEKRRRILADDRINRLMAALEKANEIPDDHDAEEPSVYFATRSESGSDCSDVPNRVSFGEPSVTCDWASYGRRQCVCVLSGRDESQQYRRVCTVCRQPGTLRRVSDGEELKRRFMQSVSRPDAAAEAGAFRARMLRNMINYNRMRTYAPLRETIDFAKLMDSLWYGSMPLTRGWGEEKDVGQDMMARQQQYMAYPKDDMMDKKYPDGMQGGMGMGVGMGMHGGMDMGGGVGIYGGIGVGGGMDMQAYPGGGMMAGMGYPKPPGMMGMSGGMGYPKGGMMDKAPGMMGKHPGMMGMPGGMGYPMGGMMGKHPGMMGKYPGMMGKPPLGIMGKPGGMMFKHPGMMGKPPPGMMGKPGGMMFKHPGMMGKPPPGMMGKPPGIMGKHPGMMGKPPPGMMGMPGGMGYPKGGMMGKHPGMMAKHPGMMGKPGGTGYPKDLGSDMMSMFQGIMAIYGGQKAGPPPKSPDANDLGRDLMGMLGDLMAMSTGGTEAKRGPLVGAVDHSLAGGVDIRDRPGVTIGSIQEEEDEDLEDLFKGPWHGLEEEEDKKDDEEKSSSEEAADEHDETAIQLEAMMKAFKELMEEMESRADAAKETIEATESEAAESEVAESEVADVEADPLPAEEGQQ